MARRSPEVASVSVENDISAQATLLPITDAIQFLAFRFWNGSAWVETWDAATLPKGVEVSLSAELPVTGTEAANNHPQVFRRIIYLPGSGAIESPLLSSNLVANAASPEEVR